MKPDPKDRTSAKPITVDGVTFHCYRCGILRAHWVSEDGRISVQRNHNADTYSAGLDGNGIAGANPMKSKRFRTQSAAMLAGVLKMRAGIDPQKQTQSDKP
jgi:hypothetical protein